jgi:Spy/CpxP family protein refolding chaperone
MRSIGGIILAFVIIVLAATAAPAPEARPLGGFETGVWLLLKQNSPRLREELRLTESQVKQIDELIAEERRASSSVRGSDGKIDRQKLRELMAELRDLTKRHADTVPKILTKTQLMRAEQIHLQRVRLAFAFRLPQVAAALKITEDQKEKMDLIRNEYTQELRGLSPVGGAGEELLQKRAELRKSQDEKTLNMLTPAQKAKWKQLLGQPFKLEALRPALKKQAAQDSDRPAVAK